MCEKELHRKRHDPLDIWRGFIVDTPGYGYSYVPIKVKNEFKRLVNGYLSHAVRLSLVLVLVNA